MGSATSKRPNLLYFQFPRFAISGLLASHFRAAAPLSHLLVLRIARDAYLTPLKRLKLVFASTWLHVAVTFAVSFVPVQDPSSQLIDLASLVGSIVWCLTAAPVALAWHRWVLLGEPISASSALRFNARALRFALLLLLVDVALSYLLGVPMWLAHEPLKEVMRPVIKIDFPWNMIAVTAAVSIPSAISTALFARLILVFPLCALDQRTSLARTSWDMSKGNAVRIFFITALTTVPLAALPFAPFYLYMWLGNFSLKWTSLMAALGVPLSVLFHLLSVPIAACAASLVYRAIAPERTGAPEFSLSS